MVEGSEPAETPHDGKIVGDRSEAHCIETLIGARRRADRTFHDEALAVRARIGDTPLSELPALAAWRKVFRGFGVDPTQYRSAAEALLRRLTKQGELVSIGTLVDLANLVSIRYALPVAVFDQRGISGGTIVRFAPVRGACRSHDARLVGHHHGLDQIAKSRWAVSTPLRCSRTRAPRAH